MQRKRSGTSLTRGCNHVTATMWSRNVVEGTRSLDLKQSEGIPGLGSSVEERDAGWIKNGNEEGDARWHRGPTRTRRTGMRKSTGGRTATRRPIRDVILISSTVPTDSATDAASTIPNPYSIPSSSPPTLPPISASPSAGRRKPSPIPSSATAYDADFFATCGLSGVHSTMRVKLHAAVSSPPNGARSRTGRQRPPCQRRKSFSTPGIAEKSRRRG